MATFGFIGIGNMGGAIAAAAAKAHDPSDMLAAAKHPERAQAFAEKHGMKAADNKTIARECKFIVLGVKPQFMEEVMEDIRPILATRDDFILVTMAAGLTMQNIAQMAGKDCPVIRIMPNTPARIGKGTILYDCNSLCSSENLQQFLSALEYAGWVEQLNEHLIDAGSAVSGSGPAYVAMFMEAMADGGVACGLPRASAIRFAAQTLIGTAEMLLATSDHPGVIKDAVCSPGGSTIQGVRALEQGGMRGAVMEAIIATCAKNKEFIK